MCKRQPSTMTQFTDQHQCTALWCYSFWCCSALCKPTHTSDCPLWREKHFMSSWACCLIKFNHSHDPCSCLLLALPHFRLPGHILSNDLPWKVYGMQHHYSPNNIMLCFNVSVCMQVFAHLSLFITGFAVSSNLPSSMQQVPPSAFHHLLLIPDGLAVIAWNLTYECCVCKCPQTPLLLCLQDISFPSFLPVSCSQEHPTEQKCKCGLCSAFAFFCTLVSRAGGWQRNLAGSEQNSAVINICGYWWTSHLC